MNAPAYTLATLPLFVNSSRGVTAWLSVSQDMIDTFAACTGDHQWIHVDTQRAQQESPFGGTIAHGFLTLALIARFGEELGVVPADTYAAFNYGIEKVRFLAPVRAGVRVRCEITIADVSSAGPGRWLLKTRNTLEIDGETKPALVADVLILLSQAAPKTANSL